MPDKRSVVAVFDFDNTLTTKDTLLPFLFYAYNSLWVCFQLLTLVPSLLGFVLRFISRQAVKEKIIGRFFKDVPYQELSDLGKNYASERLDRYLRPEGIEKLRWHQQQGHYCVLVSASLEFYLEPWAERYDFDALLSSRLATSEQGIVTGRLQGLNCWGPEKKRRLLELLGPKANGELYVYGDSRGDHDILSIADHPFYRTF